MNALFLCSQNKWRSPTAEQLFAAWPGIETDSAGLNEDAVTPLSGDQLAWADVVFVMEPSQRKRLQVKFAEHLNGKRVICLNIPDEFRFMQPELVQLLETRVGPYLR
jgi:predicted protein tyrosine phosphatase